MTAGSWSRCSPASPSARAWSWNGRGRRSRRWWRSGSACLLGASTFTPGAVRKLFKGKLGIGPLMTISAVGAVILGYVEEAAALAFLYSIAEALEDKAMDRARGGSRAAAQAGPGDRDHPAGWRVRGGRREGSGRWSADARASG